MQCRADAHTTLGLLDALEHRATRLAVTAERAFLAGLGGGCAVPVAAFAVVSGQSLVVSLTGLVSSPDGKKAIRVHGEGDDALELGQRLAEEALAQGAARILNG